MATLINVDNGEVILARLEIAATFWHRFVGLQFRRSLASGCGLLLAPCNSVHTFFCFFPLDVVFLSRDGFVLDIRDSIRPWSVVPPVKAACYVLETTAGQIALAVGDQLALSGFDATHLPKPLSDFPVCERKEPQ